MIRAAGIGGWRGWLGLLAIAVVLGLAYASLLSTVLGQWVREAGTLVGILMLAASSQIKIIRKLLGAILR